MFGSGDWGGDVAIHTGPRHDFLANLLDSTIVRLRYTPVPNQFPIAHAHASVRRGRRRSPSPSPAPARRPGRHHPVVPVGLRRRLAREQRRDGGHTYTAAGVFTAKLTVRDNDNASSVDTISIATNNSPPVLTVQPLPAGVTFAVGDTVSVVASATDPDGGPPPTITYQQVLHHCPFPGAATSTRAARPATVGTYTCVIDDHGDDTYLEIVVTALDSRRGQRHRLGRRPGRKHTLSVSSSPGGVPIRVDASDSIATPTLTEVVGSKNLVTAPSPTATSSSTAGPTAPAATRSRCPTAT